MSTSDRFDSQLYTLTLRALEDPLTPPEARQHDLIPWSALQEAEAALRQWHQRPVQQPDWNLSLLAQTLVAWGHDDPEGYAAFMAPVTTNDRARQLGTLPGLWHLNSVLNGLSDDHDYVLDTHAGAFRLGHQDQVQPWTRLIRPTELAQAIQTHRGLPVELGESLPAPARRHRPR
jgi:hypothetical protein